MPSLQVRKLSKCCRGSLNAPLGPLNVPVFQDPLEQGPKVVSNAKFQVIKFQRNQIIRNNLLGVLKHPENRNGNKHTTVSTDYGPLNVLLGPLNVPIFENIENRSQTLFFTFFTLFSYFPSTTESFLLHKIFLQLFRSIYQQWQATGPLNALLNNTHNKKSRSMQVIGYPATTFT